MVPGYIRFGLAILFTFIRFYKETPYFCAMSHKVSRVEPG